MTQLAAILHWKMNAEEVQAFKLCILWEKVINEELPNYFHNRLPKNSDPRKSLIFRYCYKLLRETKGLIPEEGYELYIKAQIQTLKSYSDGTVHALVEPACLCGEKAWMRWRIWKSRFEREMLKHTSQGNKVEIKTNRSDITIALNKTKVFLDKLLGENYQKSGIENLIKSKEIIKWAAFGKISPYYLVLSPVVKKHVSDLDDTFTIETEFLNKSITPEVEESFRQMFACEFSNS